MKDRRGHFRKGLHPEYRPLYDALCAQLPPRWQPIGGLRTLEEQQTIYARGRTTPGVQCACKVRPCPKHPRGLVVTNAQPGFSAHNWGCATDWVLFNPDGTIQWKHDEWLEYARVVEGLRLSWGGDWNGDGIKDRSDWDLPHNQLALTVPYRTIGEEFLKRGVEAAQKLLLEKIERR